MDTETVLIPAGKVRQRYGNRSHMWIERRLDDESSGFPKPVYIGRLRFWHLAELEEWERSLATKSAKSGGQPPKRAVKSAPAANDGGARADT